MNNAIAGCALVAILFPVLAVLLSCVSIWAINILIPITIDYSMWNIIAMSVLITVIRGKVGFTYD